MIESLFGEFMDLLHLVARRLMYIAGITKARALNQLETLELKRKMIGRVPYLR